MVVHRSIFWGLTVQAIAGAGCIWSARQLAQGGGEDRERSGSGWLVVHLLAWLAVGGFLSLSLSQELHPHLRSFVLVPLGASILAALAVGHGFLWPAMKPGGGRFAIRRLFRPEVFVGWLLIPVIAAGLGRELQPGASHQLVATLALPVRHPELVLAPGYGSLLVLADRDGTVLGLAGNSSGDGC